MTDFFAFQSPLYASSGSATPDLMMGAQGWSPYSSVLYSEDDHVDGDEVDFDARSTKRRSSDFPLPPPREFALKPSIVRATSAMDLAAIQKMQAWTFDVYRKEGQSQESDSKLHLADLGPLPTIIKRTSADRPTHIEMPTSTISNQAPKLEIDESAGSEPDEYPFPYMTVVAAPGLERSFSQQAEDDKLQRLQASLSLLQLGPNEDDDVRNNDLASALQLLSPEQGAPSLAEQMAYACGLGNAYAWSSPAPLDFASPAGLFHPVGLLDATTYSQGERKMASRHVRQVVASNGSAPMPRKVSMQVVTSGEMAEVGSSWSHGHGEYEEKDEIDFYESGQGAVLRSDSPLEYNHYAPAAASVESFLESPILNGALSADDFYNSAASSSNDSEIDTPLTCATSVYSNEARQYSKNEVKTDNYFTRELDARQLVVPFKAESGSPASLHEFSYIVESDELVRDLPSTLQDRFNANTFSPVLDTPELELMPSLSMSSVPPPSFDQASIEPALTTFGMPRSMSTGSVLERPRPISRLESSSFFGGMEMEYLHHQMVPSPSSASIKKSSESAGSSIISASLHSRDNSDAGSGRKSAMSTSRSMSTFGERNSETASIHSSASSRAKLDRLLSELPRKTVSFASSQSEHIISTRSSFSGNSNSLSSKALAQVKEACRAKEDHARNIEMDRWYAQEDQLKAVMAAQRCSSPQKKRLFTISRSHASESALPLINNKSAPTMKKDSSKMSLRKEVTAKSRDAIRISTHKRQTSCTVTVPDTARVKLPVVLVARTNSQRRRGITGVPETEPRALALAKMGIFTDAPTRSSRVEAVTRSSVPLEKAGLVNMPHGVILIVEEKHVEMSRILAYSP